MRKRNVEAERRILALLAGSGPQFGYPMSRMTRLRAGRLYPALTRLEERGAIVGEWVDTGIGRHPRRRQYRLVDS